LPPPSEIPKSPKWGASLASNLEGPEAINPQRAAAYLQEQLALWKQLTAELGIEAQ